ncbi:LytTR family DNA-binding domain-containing protein [Desulfitobacterium sp.]|uniref:LytR/AlgR family response regulator transcription factor n=1 Tax=Desulfitobacterium sp. TaxID=49981 RepID=UPI002B21FDFB|nr:LytTR family DNA-binding domain-containing protein [Desulfitobacterium sp.]MEA4900642.1 LytTR family DNA-binding domain-containing protein [Desulfitobacterium sp.]
MKLRALLVDDESPARKELRYLLKPFSEIQIVGEADNALEALELINNLEYSVVFLDIEMPGLQGIELAKQLQERGNSPAIIFITAHEEFAVEAFSVNALDYLLKPINSKRLEQALQKVIAYHSVLNPHENSSAELTPTVPPTAAGNTSPSSASGVSSSSGPPGAFGASISSSAPAPSNAPASSFSSVRPLEVIPVEQRGKTILLRPEEIVYFYTDKDNIFAKTQKNSYLARFTLRELESRLNSNLFFRTHRCYLVNIQRMRELIPYFNGTYTVVVDDQEKSEIPVSRMQARKLKGILGL